jgi:hypothetical protein
MSKARLLSTVAATLLLAAGVASAQDMKKDEAPARAPAAQQNAPAEKIAPAVKPSDKKAGVKPSETTGQAPKALDADKTHATDKGAMDKDATGKPSDKVPAAKNSSDANGVKGKANESTTEAPAAASPKSSQSTTTEKGATTGQGAASGSAKLSTEQRSKITTVIKQQKVERVEPSKLNISISVGARVPTSVRFYPLPSEVYVIYPEWRGYDYIMVGDQILVINPRTHEIVAILDA